MKIRNKKYNNQNIKFKSVKIEGSRKSLINNFHSFSFKNILIIILSLLSSVIILYIIIHFIIKFNNNKNILNFDYSNYERNIITEEMFQKSGWNLTNEEIYFINGIIRKFKPKKCLEIGVGKGDISILILNAIKDIPKSSLVSIDINTKLIEDHSKIIGYKVSKYFPNLSKNNWQLYTGEMPHKFLEKLNLKYDFVILDTSHTTPGEILNIIEIMPFLEENSIIIFLNLITHMKNAYIKDMDKFEIKKTPTSIFLMSTIAGKKIIKYDEKKLMENIGVIFLEKNQEKFYENYFLLLICLWENMLSDEEIYQMRLFIEKYYKKEKLINIFENAILYNKEFQKNFK